MLKPSAGDRKQEGGTTRPPKVALLRFEPNSGDIPSMFMTARIRAVSDPEEELGAAVAWKSSDTHIGGQYLRQELFGDLYLAAYCSVL